MIGSIIIWLIPLIFIISELVKNKFKQIPNKKLLILLSILIILSIIFWPRYAGVGYFWGHWYTESCKCIGFYDSFPNIDWVVDYCFGMPYSCSVQDIQH